jgi:hypothetical protein
MLGYSNIQFREGNSPLIAILIAEETPEKYLKELLSFSNERRFHLKTYSLETVSEIYRKLIEEAIQTSGVPVLKPVANNFTHLSCLNRFMLPFYDTEKKN